ncbi:hypothetical protein LguiB_021410 [Lonicera macranthoides]
MKLSNPTENNGGGLSCLTQREFANLSLILVIISCLGLIRIWDSSLVEFEDSHHALPFHQTAALSSTQVPSHQNGDSICEVKYSTNPFADVRESIVEMIKNVGVQDWSEMEELVYCYIVLNSSEILQFIEDAFLINAIFFVVENS